MGGFYNIAAKFATEGIEKIGAKIGLSSFADKAAESVERGLYHGIFPAKTAFQDIPAAKTLLHAYDGSYKETVNKLTSQRIQAAKATGNIQPAHEITRQAEKDAQDMVFGPNRTAIQGVLKHVEKTVSKNRADILADHLNIMFKEATDKEGLSRFDRDMRKGKEENSYQTNPSSYKNANLGEKIARGHQALLAYKAAVPHLASNLNILISDGFKTYAKVLATELNPTSRKGAEATVLASNAISELWEQGYKEKLAFDNGVISKFAPGKAGEFIHRNMLIPGMSRVRYETLLMSANASRMSAEEAANHFKQSNDKMALPMLRELGIDAAKLKRQNFVLDPDDIQKAYYNGTNVRAFLNYHENRTILSQRSPMFRIMGAFHGYITNQSNFFRRVFKRQYEQGDFIGIARNIGLMATAFPIVGSTIYEVERLLSGTDWDDPAQHFKNRYEASIPGQIYDALTGRENAASAARTTLNTIDGLSHVASFGVATGFIRGASRANLAGQMLGPDANMLIQGAQDGLKALHTDSTKPDAWKYLARDLMSDTPSMGLGAIASHKTLPTKAEESKNKPKKFRRHIKRKPDSWNPLNSNDFKY